MSGEAVLNPSSGEAFVQGAAPVVNRATDPVVSNVATPADFAAQYPTPLDPTEILNMCEEITLWQFIPDVKTGLQDYTWREMTSLNFNSGSSYIAFSDGTCPEEYEHDGANKHVDLKNLGVKKSLTESDIMHSAAVAAENWNGINRLVGGYPSGEGLPGGGNQATFRQEYIADLKAKEIRLGMTLVLNGWDRLLVQGDATTRPLEFDGIENWATNRSCTMHTNNNTASGTFSAQSFDRFLSESCAKAQVLAGHPQAMQEVMMAYFALGFNGSQTVQFSGPAGRIEPGISFGGYVNTSIGRLGVVADSNFRRTAAGSTTFQADIWALRMQHNGEPFIHKITQIPLQYRDLTPGCTSVSFEIWTKTALVIKACCAQSKYTSQFTGALTTTCTAIG